jgi:hypothetical protein
MLLEKDGLNEPLLMVRPLRFAFVLRAARETVIV